MLVHNSVGHVSLGDVLMITPDLLLAKVMDDENSDTDDAIFTLVPPLNNPQDGKKVFRSHDVNFIIIIIISIIGFLINVQVQGHHPHQLAPFQVTG